MAKEHVILQDTSLCAIVRDEKMNPAGGIKKFVSSHVPYVEQAVIADTGSVDGTREILEEMQAKYSNLKIVDIPFNGYADARNRSLKYVQTKRALILDADELLTHKKPQNDWEILNTFMENNPSKIYRFYFDNIYQNRIELGTIKGGHTLRLFDNPVSKDPFHRVLWEYFSLSNKWDYVLVRGVSIKHFLPKNEARELKDREWYGMDDFPSEAQVENWQKIPPSMREGFASWKKFNFRRNYYI